MKIYISPKRVFLYIQKNSRLLKQKLEAKNIAPLCDMIASLPQIQISHINLNDIIEIECIESDKKDSILEAITALKPWRKGPFRILGNTIESEWDSSIKYNIIKNHLHIKNKNIADIGCNNGYYMFRMLELLPKSIIGFDPSALCKCQFDFINRFIQSNIQFELLGIEDLSHYDRTFDVIICLGVLYHRTNPIDSLKLLKNSLNSGGEIIIDCLILDTDEPIVLSPLRYAKMKNVYFIPSIGAIKNWLFRAGFKHIEIIAKKKTDTIEQRKTKWINGESLEDFLDPNDSSKTIEGFQAPIRIYIKAKGK
ncbi:tRNA 5-methoxyuridine(34)/uridine 5-oxyacetic acid(34) synthase CmoB [Helicobacter sp. 16-1353]|nr:tRNA 5-methoxyuridine(34)/uridine 5-oxyacetic acid(34) synthase CmoB [Helicobacter sp. 16-1353]